MSDSAVTARREVKAWIAGENGVGYATMLECGHHYEMQGNTPLPLPKYEICGVCQLEIEARKNV
jgi:hypothetical protein